MERDERGGLGSRHVTQSRDRQSCDLQSRDSHRRDPLSLPARVRMERVYRHAARASSVMADAQASRPATREAPGSIHSRPCPPHPCPEAPEPRGRPCGCRSGREWMRMAGFESRRLRQAGCLVTVGGIEARSSSPGPRIAVFLAWIPWRCLASPMERGDERGGGVGSLA